MNWRSLVAWSCALLILGGAAAGPPPAAALCAMQPIQGHWLNPDARDGQVARLYIHLPCHDTNTSTDRPTILVYARCGGDECDESQATITGAARAANSREISSIAAEQPQRPGVPSYRQFQIFLVAPGALEVYEHRVDPRTRRRFEERQYTMRQSVDWPRELRVSIQEVSALRPDDCEPQANFRVGLALSDRGFGEWRQVLERTIDLPAGNRIRPQGSVAHDLFGDVSIFLGLEDLDGACGGVDTVDISPRGAELGLLLWLEGDRIWLVGQEGSGYESVLIGRRGEPITMNGDGELGFEAARITFTIR